MWTSRDAMEFVTTMLTDNFFVIRKTVTTRPANSDKSTMVWPMVRSGYCPKQGKTKLYAEANNYELGTGSTDIAGKDGTAGDHGANGE